MAKVSLTELKVQILNDMAQLEALLPDGNEKVIELGDPEDVGNLELLNRFVKFTHTALALELSSEALRRTYSYPKNLECVATGNTDSLAQELFD